MITEFIIVAALMVWTALHQEPETSVILLPNADGHHSVIDVQTDQDHVSIDKPYQMVEVSSNHRSKTMATTEQEVAKHFGELLQHTPAPERQFVLYFNSGGTDLTEESQHTLNGLLQEVSQRMGSELVIVAHTDRLGEAADNDTLSQKRAARLRERIIATGIRPELVQAFGRGEREPLVPTEDGVAQAKNRRAVVIIR